MARIRSIAPEACESRTLAELTDFEERTFTRMWTHMDDQGRAKDDPLLLCSKVYAVMRHIGEDEFEAVLARLADLDLIIRYKVKDQNYLQVRSWPRHQSPNNPAKARIPEPPGWHIDTDAREWVRDDSTTPGPPSDTNGQHEPYPRTTTALPQPSGSPGALDIGSRSLDIGTSLASSDLLGSAEPRPVDDDAVIALRADEALGVVARRRATAASAKGTLENNTARGVRGYAQSTHKALRDELGDAARQAARDHPDADRTALADELERLDTEPLGPPARPLTLVVYCAICGTHGQHSTDACTYADEAEAT